MSIRIKNIILIIILCLIGLIGIYAFSQLILGSNIENQEKKLVKHNVEHVIKVINKDIESLNATAGDWSFWDDTYYFLKGENNTYIEDNLSDDSMATLRLNVMIYMDDTGKVIHSKSFDLNTNREVNLSKDLDKYIYSGSSLLKHSSLDDIVSGVIIIDNKPMIVSARPISNSDKTELKAGTLIIGRFIEGANHKLLEDLTYSRIVITDINNRTPIVIKKSYSIYNKDYEHVVNVIDKNSIICNTVISDALGNNNIIIRMEMPRDAYNEAYSNLNLFMKVFVVTLFIMSILAIVSNEKMFLSRVNDLSSFIKNISLNKDTSQRIDIEGKDEISALAEATNNMLKEIDEANALIKKNKERLQRVLDGSSDGFWDINLSTNKIFLSLKLLDMLEYERKDILANISSIKKILTRESFSKLLKDYRAILKGDLETYMVEHYVQSKNGIWKWILFKGKVVEWDEAGKPLLIAGIAADITEVKEKNEKIEYLSYHDSLTGLYNRYYFLMELERLNFKNKFPLSLIMGDVNGLKLTNDAFGHSEGDRLLVTISEILKKSCRNKDIIARLGGDEFVIILPSTTEKEAAEVCDTIKMNCEKAEVNLIKPSIALGVFTKTTSEESIQDVFEFAEDRMYKNKLLESKSARHSIIAVMERALLETDFETREHTERICTLALRMGKYMKLPNNVIDELKLLSKLHDIGKTVIPREILTKPDKLTEDEWNIIKQHPEIGYRLALSSDDLIPIAEGILSHHEKWDGTGYPKGLKGKEIILTARIISIIDAYDVISNTRPYKKAATHDEAIDEIIRCSGTHFDPELVEIFTNMFLEEENLKNCL
jgi:diguanylate cyclase (GGDEF)-like protein/PAS domain S-box-containing protein